MPKMEDLEDLWTLLTQITLFDQELWRILLFAGFIFGALLMGWLGRWVIERMSTRQKEAGREVRAAFTGALARSVTIVLFAGALTPAFATLDITLEPVIAFVGAIKGVLMTVAIGYLVYQLVEVPDLWLRQLGRRSQSKMNDMIAPIVGKTLRAVVVLLTMVQVATVLSHKPVTSIIAGLGIGGLAVGLAAQDTIKNFFGSLSLLADKPFELGDRVSVSGIDGTVEAVGLRSTRIRTALGHLVTIPNGDLANRTIENISRRPYLRRTMNLGLTYDTPPEKVRRAVEIVKEVLRDHPGQMPDRPPRVYFSEFNDASLNLAVTYWYAPANVWDFNDASETINFEILRRFNEEGIEFAFPTQTVYLAGDPKRPIARG